MKIYKKFLVIALLLGAVALIPVIVDQIALIGYQKSIALFDSSNQIITEEKDGVHYKEKIGKPSEPIKVKGTNDVLLGYIEIPTIGLALPIYESENVADPYAQMDLGMIHDLDSNYPGENGKTVLAGHRENELNKVKNLKNGDLIVINYLNNFYLYEVYNQERISETDYDKVHKKTTEDELSFYTCYPLKSYSKITGRWLVESKETKEYIIKK